MLFEEIFKEEGLYKVCGTTNGVGYKIKKEDDKFCLYTTMWHIDTKKEIVPTHTKTLVNDTMFNQNYEKVI